MHGWMNKSQEIWEYFFFLNISESGVARNTQHRFAMAGGWTKWPSWDFSGLSCHSPDWPCPRRDSELPWWPSRLLLFIHCAHSGLLLPPQGVHIRHASSCSSTHGQWREPFGLANVWGGDRFGGRALGPGDAAGWNASWEVALPSLRAHAGQVLFLSLLTFICGSWLCLWLCHCLWPWTVPSPRL